MNTSKHTSYLNSPEGIILLFLSILMPLSMGLLANRKSLDSIFSSSQNPDIFYLALALLLAASIGTIFFFSAKSGVFHVASKFFFFLLPFEITLLATLWTWKPQLSVLFFLFAGTYLFIASFLLLKKFRFPLEIASSQKQTLGQWLASQGKSTLAIILLIMSLSTFFGCYKITKFSAVDEPLWTFDRIPSFWKNISENDWNDTRISDKPGITVALISGIGLLEVDPNLYDPDVAGSKNLDAKEMNLALRLPLVLFAVLLLPLFYFLLERLLGKRTALLTTALIALSPVLIGMSRIINPDALLWIFATLSVLSFLTYQKKRFVSYLYLAGILLGLAILTKYVANILYVFFFGMIFLEYVFNKPRYENISVRKYLSSAVLDFALLATVSLATFYLFFPGTWLKPERLFTGTVLSQAFVSTWPIFAAVFSLLLVDTFLFKSKFLGSTLAFLAGKRKILAMLISGLLLAVGAFVFLNVYAGMGIYDFEKILSSPKTSFKEIGFVGLLLSNFYPLLFGIIPLAIIGLLAQLGMAVSNFKAKKENDAQSNVAIFLILFIFLYYIGTTVNEVVSTTRYQIMLYPLILVVSGIGLVALFESVEQRFSLRKHSFALFSISVILISAASLFWSKPFYLSYASALLPEKNILDVKDMGPGSYEAAQYLNSLPDAENLSIWTDKNGVCVFFKGSCQGSFIYDELKDASFDYVVVSWGRKERTTNMLRSRSKLTNNEALNFVKYYDQTENVAYELLINGRPGQYIKVIKVK